MALGRHVVRYTGAAVLAAAAFGYAVVTTGAAFGNIGRLQDHVAAVEGAAFAERRAFLALVDEETGVRGYVATGNAVFLEAYRGGRRAYAAYRAHPPRDVGAALGLALDRFAANADAVQPYFREEIADVARGDRSRAIAGLPAGKAAFDRLRVTDARAFEELQASLVRSRQAIRDEVGRTRLAVVVMGLVLLIAGTVVAMLVIRGRENAVLARRDALTRLPNRTAFEERLETELTARRDSERLAVLYVDLDGFKPINDGMGHAGGDKVLAACGERLRRAVRPRDFVARVGGDEFAAILPVTSSNAARAIAARILSEIETPFTVAGTSVRLGASIGMAVVPDDAIDARALLRVADEAMYREKRARSASR